MSKVDISEGAEEYLQCDRCKYTVHRDRFSTVGWAELAVEEHTIRDGVSIRHVYTHHLCRECRPVVAGVLGRGVKLEDFVS